MRYTTRNNKWITKSSFLVFLAIVLFLSACQAPLADTVTDGSFLTVTFLDVGQADSILVQNGNEGVLIDAGNAEDADQVVQAVREAGLSRLAYVIGTHPDEDHIGGMAQVLEEIAAGNVILPDCESDTQTYQNMLSVMRKHSVSRLTAEPGQEYAVGGAKVRILAPVKQYTGTNENSVVAKIIFGETSFLFMGDAEQSVERDILSMGEDVRCDVLKGGHHGSGSSSGYAFLRQSNPRHIVISCGQGNAYGHPHEDALSRFRDLGATVYRTDTMGTIVMQSDGKTVVPNTEGEGGTREHTSGGGLGNDVSVSEYIGNKNSKKYHLPECSSLPQEKNRIHFASRREAVEAGFTPCGGCKP